ncbi:MAG: hypothetical protein MK102_19530 [Fuerstiella sp.]|nr:hypothetical protein [Fuerstiella sp.]
MTNQSPTADKSGLKVQSNDGRTKVLLIWHVTTQGKKGETPNQMLTLAGDDEGQRVPAWVEVA